MVTAMGTARKSKKKVNDDSTLSSSTRPIRTMGLPVDELVGGQDIVIKSLTDNFMHLRGLSGAQHFGDGSVGLLMDVGAAIDLTLERQRQGKRAERMAVNG